MSIFGKLKFWKSVELGLGDELAMPKGNLPTDELGLESPSLQKTPQMQQMQTPETFQEPVRPYIQQPQQPQYYGPNKDLELVAAKLDALKATLDNINQRLASLERVAYGEEQQRKVW